MTLSPSTKLREAGSPKPVRRPFGRRLSATHVLIGVVVILAFVLNFLVLQDRGSTTLVAVADSPLSVGAVVGPDDIRLVPVDSSFEGLAGMLTERDLDGSLGYVASRSIPEGAPIGVGDLIRSGSGPGLRAMSIPISVEHAAGGALVVGDRVDIIGVSDGAATYIASDLEVTAVAGQSATGLGTGTSFHLTLAVEAEEALQLAEAMAVGDIEVVKSTGATSSVVGEESGDD